VAVLHAVTGLCAVLLVWSVWGTLDIVASAEGRLIPQTHLKIVQPAEAGVVREILVRDGQRVAQGEVLMRLDAEQAAADARALARRLALLELQQRRIEAELTGTVLRTVDADPPDLLVEVRAQWQARRQAHADAVNQERAQMEQIGHERQAALAQLQRLQTALPSLERGAGAFATLGQQGFFSPVAVDEKQREVTDKQHELLAQRSTLAGLDSAHEAARRRLAQLESAYRADLQQERVDASAQAAQTLADRDKLRHRMSLLELRAPQAGVIKDLATRTVGSVVAPGHVLMSLVPEADPLLAEVWVRNEDIGFVHPGQAVQVKLAAYPFQKYGLLAGEVIHLGPDAADAPAALPEGSGVGAAALPRYRALVQLKAQQRDLSTGAMPLTAGMQVTVDILLGERSVLNYLLSPLQRAWHDAARER
jgi:HlyD family secretion protein